METNTQREKAIKWWNNLDYQERDFYSAFGTVKVDEQLIIDSYLSSTKPTETNTNTVEEAAVIHAQKSWGVYFDDMHPDVAIQNTMGEISIKDFHSGALWQKEQDEAKYKALEESHAKLLSKLEQATERMTRARDILNREDGQSNWGMLECSDFREAITNAKKLNP